MAPWSSGSCAPSCTSRMRGRSRARPRSCISRSRRSRRPSGELEAELGFELLRRTSRGVELTEAGEVVFERAREIVAGADAIRSDLAALRGLLEGTVALGTMLPPGPIDLPGLLASFHDSHPGIAVRVREGSAPDILAQLKRDELDVAFTGVETEALEDGLAGERMLGEELLLITPPDHRPLSLAELSRRAVRRLPARLGAARHRRPRAARRARDARDRVRDRRAGQRARAGRARARRLDRAALDRRRRRPARPGDPDRARAPAHGRVARAAPAAGRRRVPELRARRACVG